MSRADKDVDGIVDTQSDDPGAEGRGEGDPGVSTRPASETADAPTQADEPSTDAEAVDPAEPSAATEPEAASGPSMPAEAAEPAGPEGAKMDSDESSTTADEFAVLQDRLMRQAAEFQNYRRRTEAEKTGMVGLGKAMVVQQLLDVLDDLERSLEAARAVGENPDQEAAAPAFESLRQGVELVYTKFREELSRVGVEEIESVGRPFDEHAHDAMMQQPAAEGQESGIVVGEIQKGYRLGDRVLRHARVIVSA